MNDTTHGRTFALQPTSRSPINPPPYRADRPRTDRPNLNIDRPSKCVVDRRSKSGTNAQFLAATSSGVVRPLRLAAPQAAAEIASAMDLYTPTHYPSKSKVDRPWLTFLAVAANCVVMLCLFAYSDWEVAPLPQNWMISPPLGLLHRFGSSYRDVVVNGEYWRLFSSVWLHAGLVHLFFNMLALWRIGSDLESEHGSIIMISTYLFSAICGSVMSACFNRANSVTTGASGALFGLFGSDLAYFVHYYHDLGPSRWMFISTFIFSSVIAFGVGLHPMLDNFAHIGGYFGGMFLSLAILSRFRSIRGRSWMKYNQMTLIICLIFTAVSLLYAGGLIYILFGEVDVLKLCPGIRHLSCIETPWWECPPFSPQG